MTSASHPPTAATDAQPVLSLIQQIKDKRLSPAALGTEDRRRCVEVLRAEGYTLAEIAQILQKSERTIRRDVEAIRSEYALSPDPRLSERLIGEMGQQAETSIAHLRRIARESGASAMERAMAESFAWKVFKDLIEKYQSVGYLPKVPTGVVAELYHKADEDAVASYEALEQQLQQLRSVASESGEQDERAAMIAVLTDEVRRGCLEARIEKAAMPLTTRLPADSPEETAHGND